MTIKSDVWIRRMATEKEMISPFLPELVREKDGKRIISAGASSCGYDMRLADDGFRVFSSFHGLKIDPKHFETFKMPRNVAGVALGKSAYARFS